MKSSASSLKKQDSVSQPISPTRAFEVSQRRPLQVFLQSPGSVIRGTLNLFAKWDGSLVVKLARWVTQTSMPQRSTLLAINVGVASKTPTAKIHISLHDSALKW